MSSILPFNSVIRGGATTTGVDFLDPTLFVNGSGVFNLTGTDVMVSCADGKQHWVRLSIDRTAQFVAFDNQMDKTSDLTTNANLLATGNGSEELDLQFNGTSIYKRRGIMHGGYNAEQQVSQLQIVFDSEIYPLT